MQQLMKPCKPLLVGLVLSLCFSAAAAVRTVSNLNDYGPGSLRDTISASASGDTINFTAGLTGTITLTNGELYVNKDLAILGPGYNSLNINVFNGSSSRVFS